MAQANYVQDDGVVDYTPGSAVTGGDVIVNGDTIGIAKRDIAASSLGSVATEGVFDVVKVTGAISDRADVYWDADGDPVSGTAGSGAASTDPSVGNYLGKAVAAALSGDERVRVELAPAGRTTLTNAIADPGASGAIPVTRTGHVAIVTAGAETRTLARPSFMGQQLQLNMKTDGGDCVITVTGNVNQTGNNTITLNDAGDSVLLTAKRNGSNLAWSVVVNDGASLTTV
jgi:predicted RecA/RadA family phage recombinase